MKLNFTKLTIFSLVFAVFFSGLFCCCFTDLIQAEEPVPSCHQTHDNETSKNTEDCECDQTLAVLEKDFIKLSPSETIMLLSFDSKIGYKLYSPVVSAAYHAPPIIYDTSPLYIKHSILRI